MTWSRDEEERKKKKKKKKKRSKFSLLMISISPSVSSPLLFSFFLLSFSHRIASSAHTSIRNSLSPSPLPFSSSFYNPFYYSSQNCQIQNKTGMSSQRPILVGLGRIAASRIALRGPLADCASAHCLTAISSSSSSNTGRPPSSSPLLVVSLKGFHAS